MDFFRPFLDPGQLKGIVLAQLTPVLDFLAFPVAFFHQVHQFILVPAEPVTGFPAQLHIGTQYPGSIKRSPVRTPVFQIIAEGR